MNERGLGQLLVVIGLLVGILVAAILVQTKTNILPKASSPNDPPRTAFYVEFDSYVPKGTPNYDQKWTNQSMGNFQIGDQIAVNVAVSSDIDPTNTFSAVVTYPADLLEVIKIIKEKPVEASSSSQASECSEAYTCPIGYKCDINASCEGSSCTNFQPGGRCSIAPPSQPGQTLENDLFIQFWLPETGFDNTSGKVTLSGGVSGQGIKTNPPVKPVMAQIVFKAKKAGEAKLDFTEESLILRNADASNILSSKIGRSIYIEDPNEKQITGDLNGDKIVNGKDFSILLSKWGSADAKADINRDGKVNMHDFSTLISNWTK